MEATVDPTTLVVAANVRKDTKLTKEFVDSIKQHGVLVPILVVDHDGTYSVLDGQRRTLAAVDAGVKLVPVVTVKASATESHRIIDQLVVNEHREEISNADAVTAVKDLELFGMTTTAIAKKTGIPKKVVDTAIKVGSSPAATAAMVGTQLSFDAAALIAEFDDMPEAQANLIERSAHGYDLDHYAQQYRDQRLSDALAAEIEATEGLTLIEAPAWNASNPMPVSRLYTDAKCTNTNNLGDMPLETLIELAGIGLCAWPVSRWDGDGRSWHRAYAIKDWKDRGLFARDEGQASTKATTPEEIIAEKEARKVARESTKAWVSATAVRRIWIAQLLQRKTLPDGWEAIVTDRLVDNDSHSSNEWRTTLQLLGLKETSDNYSLRGDVAAHMKKAPTTRLHTALAVALAAFEGGFEFDRKGWSQKKAPAYLLQLETWGYHLSEIEALVVGRQPGLAAEPIAS